MNDGFSSNFTDIDKMIKHLDLMDENVNKGVRVALSKSADSIMKEQKQRVPHFKIDVLKANSIFLTVLSLVSTCCYHHARQGA